jgi:hypothetical protein
LDICSISKKSFFPGDNLADKSILIAWFIKVGLEILEGFGKFVYLFTVKYVQKDRIRKMEVNVTRKSSAGRVFMAY